MNPRNNRSRGWWCWGACLAVAASPALAASGARSISLWHLFRQSFDLFSIVLIGGSLIAVGLIVRCILDIRERAILPEASVSRLRDLVAQGRAEEIGRFVEKDAAFTSRVVRAAIGRAPERAAMREAAELAASEECARWFRKIEPLNVIGNLGPLVGLAGTVWGMIIAFTTLGETGGTAQAPELSLGISKALFHTLLGLCLAIPCLIVFGLYRSVIDRVCTRAMAISSELVEKLPVDAVR